MNTTRAAIEWISKEQGGRSKPPRGVGTPPYSTVVRFVDEPWPPMPIAWSLVIEKHERLSTEYKWIADVSFLSQEAPHDELRDGREFELYEGNKRVASGVIIGSET